MMIGLWILAALLFPAGLAWLALRRRGSRSGPTTASPSDGGYGPWMSSDLGENPRDMHGHDAGSETGAGGGGDGGASDGGGD